MKTMTRVYQVRLNNYSFHFVDRFNFIDKKVLTAIRCMQLLFIQAKLKKVDGDIPFILKCVPVSF